jgi:hypothetical protein
MNYTGISTHNADADTSIVEENISKRWSMTNGNIQYA